MIFITLPWAEKPATYKRYLALNRTLEVLVEDNRDFTLCANIQFASNVKLFVIKLVSSFIQYQECDYCISKLSSHDEEQSFVSLKVEIETPDDKRNFNAPVILPCNKWLKPGDHVTLRP